MIGPGSDKNLFFGVSGIECCGTVVMHQVLWSRGEEEENLNSENMEVPFFAFNLNLTHAALVYSGSCCGEVVLSHSLFTPPATSTQDATSLARKPHSEQLCPHLLGSLCFSADQAIYRN